MAKLGIPYQEFVASVVEALDPSAHVEHSLWVNGPDGKRDMDVLVRCRIESKEYSILIECKDFDPRKTGKVGIEYVDAIDSKVRDLKIDSALICSNAGFTNPAIKKATRKNIGLISVLKSGDKRVKVEIREKIYTPHMTPSNIHITFNILGDHPPEFHIDNITYKGLPVINWVYSRMTLIAIFNPSISQTFYSTFKFKSSAEFHCGKTPFAADNIEFDFHLDSRWLSQILQIDTSMGIYDYIRGRARIGGPGPITYSIKDYNHDNGTPIDFIPYKTNLGEGIVPGEVDMRMAVCEWGSEGEVPNLDELIVPEDLVWEAKDEDLK